MSLPIMFYGAADCDDTERTRDYLNARGTVFSDINIDDNPEAERFVIFINGGFRSTPTIVLDAGKLKIVLTEPSIEQLEIMLNQYLASG